MHSYVPRTCLCACAHTHTVHARAHTHCACICTCRLHASVHVCVCVYIYMYIYVYICIHIFCESILRYMCSHALSTDIPHNPCLDAVSSKRRLYMCPHATKRRRITQYVLEQYNLMRICVYVTYADVCWRMLTYMCLCVRMLLSADFSMCAHATVYRPIWPAAAGNLHRGSWVGGAPAPTP